MNQGSRILLYVIILYFLYIFTLCEFCVTILLVILHEYSVAGRMQDDEMKKIMEERRREKDEEKRAKLVVAVFVIKKAKSQSGLALFYLQICKFGLSFVSKTIFL